jgi:hypothetical protein
MPLSISEAEAELSRALVQEQEIAAELAAIEKQLSESETSVGERLLTARQAGDQKTIQKINDEVLKFSQKRRLLRSTHEASLEAIKRAKHEINQARGRDLRAQAAEIVKQVKARQAKTDKLLTELHEHEGIAYFPQPQSRAGVLLPGTIAESKTAKFAKDAAALIRQAEKTENQIVTVEPTPSTNGRISGAVLV